VRSVTTHSGLRRLSIPTASDGLGSPLIYPAIGRTPDFLSVGAVAPARAGCWQRFVPGGLPLKSPGLWPISQGMSGRQSEAGEHLTPHTVRRVHPAMLLAVASGAVIIVLVALTDPRLLTLIVVGSVLAAMARGNS